jgi:hypothetical protein
MRSNFNRQARRAGLCIGARRRGGRRRVISSGRVALTAHGPGVAETAAEIADELELTAELVELLSAAGLPPISSGRTFEAELQALTGAVPGR